MVYKLAHGAEIDSLPFQVSGKLYDNLLEFLLVLDNEYGADRNVEQDDGAMCCSAPPAPQIAKSSVISILTALLQTG